MKREEIMEQLCISEDCLMRMVDSSNSKVDDSQKSRNYARFTQLCNNIPSPGDVLESKDGEPVPVFEDWRIGNDQQPVRLLFCNGTIDEDATGWYLHSKSFGLKCLLSYRTQDKILRGGSEMVVRRLVVIKRTQSGRALICDAE